MTAVMAAAEGGHKETVEVLVKECGADVHAANKNGKTAVMHAAQYGHKETVEVLVKEFGAHVPFSVSNPRTIMRAPVYVPPIVDNRARWSTVPPVAM